MSEQRFTFGVGQEGTPVTVESWDELIDWLMKERANWDWLARGSEADLPNQQATRTQNEWDQLLNVTRQYQSTGQALATADGPLQVLRGGALLVSSSADGIQVLDIRLSAGDVAAAFAYAFLKNSVEWSAVRRTDALLGVLLTVLPDMTDAAEIAARLKAERKRFQDSLRSGMARFDDGFRDRESRFDALVTRGKEVALKTLRRRKDEWQAQQGEWGKQALASVADINGVKDSYLQFMQLRAPVEYWTAKSEAHKTAAQATARNLAAYFVVLTLVLGAAFFAAGNFLLNYQSGPGTAAPTALYIVISGGLALLSTVGFWVGRLLTRLYLSEHHLRTDADERAVMTQTYLALTQESGSAATETERAIILAALFRSSADGIVKDDGPPDLGVQAILSKAMAR